MSTTNKIGPFFDVLRGLRDEVQARLLAAQQYWVQNSTFAAGATTHGAMFGNLGNQPVPPADGPPCEPPP